jgi:NAD(P)-dependent dehydrogenase (short-subunit alcohol dehydrogenase family)
MATTADYDMTDDVHSDTYPAIDPAKADFKGKAVFTSGASRGLGRTMCVSFAKAGASMIALGARGDTSETQQAVKDAATAVGKPAPRVLPIKFDVADRDSVDAAAAEVRNEFGRMDIVIANAAVLETGKIAEGDPDAWIRTFTTNTVGLYLLYRSFIPLMLEGGDKTIVAVSSVGAHLVGPGYSAYQTSKYTVLRLAEFACAEYGDQGLLAYTIHPGNIPTDMVGGMEGLRPELKHGEFYVGLGRLCA